MKQNLLQMLDKPMDRKEFLKQLGVGSLFLFGGGMIWQALSDGSKRQQSVGYGGGAYGGKREN